MNLAQILVKGSVLVFVVSSMLAIGLSASIDRIVAPLARPVWVLRALVANFVLAPALVVAMTRLLPLEPGYELGLMRSRPGRRSPGAPAGPPRQLLSPHRGRLGLCSGSWPGSAWSRFSPMGWVLCRRRCAQRSRQHHYVLGP
jgi:hypothetical protein